MRKNGFLHFVSIAVIFVLAQCSGKTVEVFLGDDSGARFAADCVFSWTENVANPLFGGSSNSVDRAYYPFVLKIGSTYHIWYGDGDGTRHAASQYHDFRDIAHPAPEITVGGTLISGLGYLYMYHPYVLYSSTGWTVNGSYYSDPFLMYITPGFNSVRAFRSADGVDWTEIGLCSGITGVYGPQGLDVYTFAVLFEGGTSWKAYADNGGGQIQYYTSANGFDWTGQAANIISAPWQSWEVSTNGVIAPFVIKNESTYILYYSGGTTSNDQAIGKAVSTDGYTFTKDVGNPVFSKNDGVAWRDARTYTAKIIRDVDRWRMYFTGRSSTGVYSVGTAVTCGNF